MGKVQSLYNTMLGGSIGLDSVISELNHKGTILKRNFPIKPW